MKLSKFITIGFIVTLVASPILTTSTTVSAAQNNLESVANTFEETNESITNFEFVRQSTTEIVYNYSKDNMNYQTIEKIDFKSGKVETTTYEIKESDTPITVSIIKTELIDNSLYQEGIFYGEEFSQNIELGEVEKDTGKRSADNRVTPFMDSNWEYLKTFKTSTYAKGLTVGAIALAISKSLGYVPHVYAQISAYLIEVAAMAYSMNLTYVYNSEDVYRIFDYSTPVPTIMGERVTIKQYSNSSRTNLIGQKIVYYY
ncbi:hypothetical protein ACWOE3_12840 [Enterococcus dispar]|uniref:Uncharacterized protein n=1 Tax=Enterococcus dispar ATCC 51266 TaxID=1139219 RepID=S0KJW1_9ENTE|nr:hypothetical protein [Enterococcus dispar]EOT41270.1 hypothetical protein OMK_01441 [Enterococcus dispar ATCC 51266]EOW87096.1 hypothetical protein I569_02465 [Enterococcus dispar ATCC 51266]